VSDINELLDVMRRLRDPETGCAWDVKQTFATIAPYTIEEAYEVADAIEREHIDDLRDELGDLLLQVDFHAQMAQEQNAFSFDDVVQSIVAKLIRRHPHVFGDISVNDADAVKQIWEAEKARERLQRANRGGADTEKQHSELDGVAGNLPALKRAEKLQGLAAQVGFDWPDIAPVWHKMQEEVTEFKEAVSSSNTDNMEDELGDVLFTVVNLARHHKLDPEAALRRANNKFETRFREVERLAVADGLVMTEADMAELDVLWDKAKLQFKE